MAASFRPRVAASVTLAVAIANAGAPGALGAHADRAPAALGSSGVDLGAGAFGRSGALRSHAALPGATVQLSFAWSDARPDDAWYRWIPLDPAAPVPAAAPLPRTDALPAPIEPGAYRLEMGWPAGGRTFEGLTLLVLVPFDDDAAVLEGYRIGRYPAGAGRYARPAGFIRVTEESQHLRLSEHFTLREFLTHDQAGVWPKFALVDPLLIDKLELLMHELASRGIAASRMIVMSGFRTPQYNERGLDQGRARLSRHQYGDAADVWVDVDGDWYMDDLDGDGRRDTRDARVMLDALERVESRHRDLVGGAGVYPDNGAHGPFLHVDVRGSRARW